MSKQWIDGVQVDTDEFSDRLKAANLFKAFKRLQAQSEAASVKPSQAYNDAYKTFLPRVLRYENAKLAADTVAVPEAAPPELSGSKPADVLEFTPEEMTLLRAISKQGVEFNPKRDLPWIYQNLPFTDMKDWTEEPPSPGAAFMLKKAQTDAKYFELFTRMYERIATAFISTQDIDRFEDRGTSFLKLVDLCERAQAEAAEEVGEDAVLPFGAPESERELAFQT